jgi:hypothetical protein
MRESLPTAVAFATPALDAWRLRAARAASFGPTDALWLAACWEQTALAAISGRARTTGDLRFASACLERADEVLAAAVEANAR